MKKTFIMMVAMLTMSLTVAYAENEENEKVASTAAYNMQLNMGRLANVLELNSDQLDAVEEIHNVFCKEMMLAAQETGDDRKALMEKAVKKDVRYMRYILDREQYRKYLLLLNLTLRNRGLM